MKYFLDLCIKRDEFCINHKDLITFGIFKENAQSIHIKERIKSLNLIENKDFELTNVREFRIQGGTSIKKIYMFNPKSFKKIYNKYSN